MPSPLFKGIFSHHVRVTHVSEHLLPMSPVYTRGVGGEHIPKPLPFGVKPIVFRRDPGCARKARDPGLRYGTPFAVEDGDFRGLYSPTFWVAGEARAVRFVVPSLKILKKNGNHESNESHE